MDGIATLHFSEKALERARRRMLIIELCMPVFYAAFLLLTPRGRIGTGIDAAVALIILVGIETILIVESGIFFRKTSHLTL